MTKRRVNAILLCEDQQQQVFVYQWLKTIGANNIQIRINPPGQGSAEQYVRQRYPIEVKALRRINRIRPIGVSLVTVIDADVNSVEIHHRELNSQLEEAQLDPRQDGEKIAILVPKRNIETWIHYLRGIEVDEETVYAKLPKPSDCQNDVKNFVQEILAHTEFTAMPESLTLALIEMERIT